MGNRAVITTPERKIGLYLHWNGGRDSVEPFLAYCQAKGYRPPERDGYGWARLAQVIGNFFGGTLSLGIIPYTTDRQMDPGDNGIYVIENWKIVARVGHFYPAFVEQAEYDFDEFLACIDASMPESEQLGAYLFAEEVTTTSLRLGDQVWYDGHYEKTPTVQTVMGFSDAGHRSCGGDRPGTPYLDVYEHDGEFWWNSNNYIRTKTCKLYKRREDVVKPEEADA